MSWVAAAMGAASLVSGMMGQNQQRQAQRGAQAAQQRATDLIGGVKLPDTELMKLALETPELIGQYNPLLEQQYQLGPSSMEGVSTDPRLAQAQMSALEQLSGYAKGEMTPADASMMEQIRRGAAAQGQARQQAILSEMQQRGQGGSGAELIAKLKSGQAEADRASQEGMALQQQLQQRALQALSQQGQLAGSVRNQEFGEKSDIAKSKDIINQFNLQNKQNVGQRNVSSQNTAQLANLGERQRLADQAVNMRNRQQEYNKGLEQTRYNNELQRALGMAGREVNLANTLTSRGAADAQGITTGMQGAANSALAAMMMNKQQPSAPTSGTWDPNKGVDATQLKW
jgi:hypothetical protein